MGTLPKNVANHVAFHIKRFVFAI
ncbi:hypothetical protein MPL1032_140142 [Mesorhizobium plurifarium]|uniref:Uncharacterized protein n=1 Tax=Mesorhizobium plurifarium TaxID=69974 RepID=A0A090GV78_MESPL|nr:hypothetical protein MPL1032_140142 [Mesorhizobium plurifarium]CDX59106.1 hypothetical protein MPL3365_30467 [Mesorhizobium plurifarium]